MKTIQKAKIEIVRIAEIELADLMGIGMTFVVLGIGLSYGLSVQADIRDDLAQNDCSGWYNDTSKICQSATGVVDNWGGTAYNASQKAIEANAKIPSKLPMIATVLLASIIIGLLVRYLWGSFGGQNKQ
jgi:hypothetical protein